MGNRKNAIIKFIIVSAIVVLGYFAYNFFNRHVIYVPKNKPVVLVIEKENPTQNVEEPQTYGDEGTLCELGTYYILLQDYFHNIVELPPMEEEGEIIIKDEKLKGTKLVEVLEDIYHTVRRAYIRNPKLDRNNMRIVLSYTDAHLDYEVYIENIENMSLKRIGMGRVPIEDLDPITDKYLRDFICGGG